MRALFATLFVFVSFIHGASPQVDWLFPIGAQRGSEALAQIGGKYNWPLKVWSESDGIKFLPEKEKKGFYRINIEKSVTPGPYLIRFHDNNGSAQPRVFFVGKAVDVPEKEPNNEMFKPQVVTNLPAVIHGKFGKSGDVDSYQFSLKKGQTLVAHMDAYTAGVSMDALMLLRDKRGVKLAFNHDAHSLDPRLIWRCSRDGDYVLQMACFKFPANSSSSFDGGADRIYRVTLTNGPWVRHAWPGSLAKGESAKIKLVGQNIGNHEVTVAASKEEKVVLPVEAANGPLRLSVLEQAQIIEKEPNDNNETANLIKFPVTVSARIDKPGDMDCYAFEARKGGKYRFDIDSFKDGFLLDSQLSLADDSGKELLSNDDFDKKRDPLLNWAAPADGRYIIRVRSLLNKGGMEFFYRLHLTRPQPSFNATVPNPQFDLNAGTTNEVKVAVNYLDGYKGKLTITAENLPKGIVASSVAQEKKGTAVLKIVANQDAPPFSGPLSLLIGPAGEESNRKKITCALTSSGVNNGVPQGFPDYVIPETSHLWITVLPPKKVEKKVKKSVEN